MRKLIQFLHDWLPVWAADWLDILVPAVEVVLIGLISWLLMRLVRKVIRRITGTYGLPVNVASLFLRVMGAVIYGGAALWALERMGVSGAILWTAFTGFATVGAVAFFAAWSVLSNLFCTLLIYITRSFRIGDVVELLEAGDKPGMKGRVMDINLVYTTLLESGDAQNGTSLQLPNSLFFQRVLRRWNGTADIERAAERCRQAWELGLGPIEHTTRLAENVGALVTHFQGVSTEIDALSVAAHRPIIVRNEAKLSTCRQRFDVSHELGHFVLHSGRITGDRITESEANRFAGALLVPRSMMAKLFPRPRGSRLDWVGLREFKMTWKVSKAALLYRARQLDLISDDQYKTGAIMLRRSGEANGEREDSLIPAEQPELLRRSFDVLASRKGMFAEDIAKAMHIGVDLLSDLVGFDPPRRDTPRRPALKLVT